MVRGRRICSIIVHKYSRGIERAARRRDKRGENFCGCRHHNLHTETKDKARVATFHARDSHVKLQRNIEFRCEKLTDRRDSVLRLVRYGIVHAFGILLPRLSPLHPRSFFAQRIYSSFTIRYVLLSHNAAGFIDVIISHNGF